MDENRNKPFTVAQLIAELQKLPPDMRVMVRWYEGGYNDCGVPKLVQIKLNQNTEWYYGAHDDPGSKETADITVAVI